jgi:hypothetical protein
VTNLSLPAMAHLQSRRRHFSAWSAKSHIMNVVRSGILADEFRDKRRREWTKQALMTLEEATESYMVEVIAEALFSKQQLISYRFSTCLQLWRGKEVGYS